MEEIIDLIATNASASEINSKIKDALYVKASEKLDDARPFVAASLFGTNNVDEYDDEDYTQEEE
jgi:hypothetical protein